MSKRIRPRKTERVYDMIGQSKAKEFALADIRQDSELGKSELGKYMGILVYSVEQQLKCFNNVSVCSIEDLADDIIFIPIPPRKEKRNGEIVSVYENQCLFSGADIKKASKEYSFQIKEWQKLT
jgi:hypothetical protein